MTGKKRGLRNKERGDETDKLSKFSGSDTETEAGTEQAQLSENTVENRGQNFNLFAFASSFRRQSPQQEAEREEAERTIDTDRDPGNMPYLNTQNSDLHGQAPREPQTLGAS